MSEYDDWTECLDADDWAELEQWNTAPHLCALEAVKDRTAAELHARDCLDVHYGNDPDDVATSPREHLHALARLELVTGQSAHPAGATRETRTLRKCAALYYRRRATAALRLLTASDVWDDRELLTAVALGRDAITAMLRDPSTTAERRAVLDLALSILDELAQVTPVDVDVLPALEDNAPADVERAHHRHRRRRAGPCLQRPHLVHARRADDPYPPRAVSSQPCGANRPRFSPFTFTGGRR